MVKYAAALVLVVTVAAALAVEQTVLSTEQQPQQQQNGADEGVSWTEVIACYKKPQAAIGCLESRMSRAMVSMRDTAVGLAHSDPDTAAEDVAGVGDLVQQIGDFITYGISSYFHGGDSGGGGDEDETAAPSAGGSPVNAPKDLDEGELSSLYAILLSYFIFLFSYYTHPPTHNCTHCFPNNIILLSRLFRLDS